MYLTNYIYSTLQNSAYRWGSKHCYTTYWNSGTKWPRIAILCTYSVGKNIKFHKSIINTHTLVKSKGQAILRAICFLPGVRDNTYTLTIIQLIWMLIHRVITSTIKKMSKRLDTKFSIVITDQSNSTCGCKKQPEAQVWHNG